ncbi:ABC transporter permease DevC [Nostoc sp. MS1]|uniref:ABC transporter permease DevC n=1 Tax=Nostoc sp. MS1 TaxID=2764711 RepID=UPI001CC3A2EB|nr:ABC transporter permease DevC [Nostoc sp. MS1]BCL39004.1 ABC transporter [Nostoc sp. MS1]
MIFEKPLAWLQLTYKKNRMIVAVAGITFAVFLMFMQLGLQAGLYESATAVHRSLRADLVLIHYRSLALYDLLTFPRRYLYQAINIDGVESVSPLYVGFAEWQSPTTPFVRRIYVFGFNPERPAFDLPEVYKNLDKIKNPDIFLFDNKSRPVFGINLNLEKKFKEIELELNNKRVKISGIYNIGPSFESDGSLITSDINFMRIFPLRNGEYVDLGLIKLKEGIEVSQVIDQLKHLIPKEIRIMTHQDLIDYEKNFWGNNRPIGIIFLQGAILGFIIGTVFIYQIIYTDVSEHLNDYAILKVRGYTNKYLIFIVFQEALILSILGYVPGLIISIFMYKLTESLAFLPIYMTFNRALLVLFLSIFMSSIAGLIAIQKLRDADPVDLLI